MAIRVDFSNHFTELMEGLTDNEQLKIGELTVHLETVGFPGLPGRNKQSNLFSPNFLGKKRLLEEAFAIDNQLWHYHIGHVSYRTVNARGDWTSEFVVHYQNLTSNSIRFVHYSSHYPVFRNPTAAYLI